jgi:uncharacterized protein (DUF2062 family)
MKKLFNRFLPDPEALLRNRWLRWLGPRLLHRRLWHFSRRGVALGVAVGVFFGFLIPLAQIPLAAGVAVLLRANVPTAVAGTLVTNPVTFAPVYLFAHRLGDALLDTGEAAPDPEAIFAVEAQSAKAPAGWWTVARDRILGVGKPLLLGLTVLAVSCGALTYLAIMIVWRLRTAWTWRRRRGRQGP